MKSMVFASSSVPMEDSKVMGACEIVRTWMVDHYGEGVNMAGHCIEASDLLVQILHLLGYVDARTAEGWVKYDDDRYAESGYDAHTWVELGNTYIDVTADQFNYGMFPENKFKGIIICEKYPHGVCLDP